MSAEDHEFEPIPGLPADLPPGETIVWQGRPQWRMLARRAFKVRWLAAYFGVFVAARTVSTVMTARWLEGAVQLLAMIAVFSACLGLCHLLAWLAARSTLYTITTHRVVMRIGVALPVTWNLPFARIAAADLVVRAEGDGDVVLQLVAPDRVALFHLWPHSKVTRLLRASPAMRAIAEPSMVAARLEQAVTRWSAQHGELTVTSAPLEPRDAVDERPEIRVGVALTSQPQS
jgi:hypothetical protein